MKVEERITKLTEPEEFKKLRKEVNNDLTITKENVLEKSLQVPKLYSKYLNIFIALFRRYKALIEEKDVLYKKLYHEYKYEFKYELKNTEVNLYIKGDEKFMLKCSEINDVEHILKYFEKILENIKQISFNVKNFIDYTKFLNGE